MSSRTFMREAAGQGAGRFHSRAMKHHEPSGLWAVVAVPGGLASIRQGSYVPKGMASVKTCATRQEAVDAAMIYNKKVNDAFNWDGDA